MGIPYRSPSSGKRNAIVNLLPKAVSGDRVRAYNGKGPVRRRRAEVNVHVQRVT